MGNPFLLPQAKLQQGNWLLRDGGPTRTYRSDSHRLLLCRADDRSARKTIVNTQGGIELDVLIGHPEHDLLFVATQVARVKDPSASVSAYRKTLGGQEGVFSLKEALLEETSISVPTNQLGRQWRTTTALGTESWVYRMLLRTNAKASEPFRKWVTEEVLPTIRKTGSYDAAKSVHP